MKEKTEIYTTAFLKKQPTYRIEVYFASWKLRLKETLRLILLGRVILIFTKEKLKRIIK